ncbi:MAG: hypothetical protein IPG11_17890 [Flavobacteriales bacterium]|jgi:hypothetical protein|nr:hypothetical protein [Flavobacteriales bacterium]MBK7619887.1 hypothetical protein [Flavobacteriales bacterium]
MTFRKLLRYALPLALIGIMASSCNKETAPMPNPTTGTDITDPDLQRELWDMGQKLPAVGIYNHTMNEILVFRSVNDGSRSFAFSTMPASGINFASSNGGQWVWTEEGGIVVITEPQAGLGAGGGLISAGNTTLDINIAVCFALGDEALGGGLFGPDMGDVAGVIGISGDIEALQNGDFSDGSDPFQYFHGFAYYFVYAEQLSDTSYDVLNWIEDLGQSEDDLQDFSFAFVISFQNEGGIYLSKDGSITVNGGTMQFNGNYYSIEGVGFFDDDDEEDASYSVVSGYGAMGCN